MKNSVQSIGIIGAGKVGIVLAQLGVKAGYNVYVAGSGDVKKIALTVSVLVPGASALKSTEVAKRSDVIILAIPLGRYKELPKKELEGKLVIDAMNYWWETDGERPEFTNPNLSTSEIVQQFLSKSRVVKAFSHIGYHDLYDETRPESASDRKAVAIAGDKASDVDIVSDIVNKFGFDPVLVGTLSKGIKLQPGGPIFGAHVNAATLTELLQTDSNKHRT